MPSQVFTAAILSPVVLRNGREKRVGVATSRERCGLLSWPRPAQRRRCESRLNPLRLARARRVVGVDQRRLEVAVAHISGGRAWDAVRSHPRAECVAQVMEANPAHTRASVPPVPLEQLGSIDWLCRCGGGRRRDRRPCGKWPPGAADRVRQPGGQRVGRSARTASTAEAVIGHAV